MQKQHQPSLISKKLLSKSLFIQQNLQDKSFSKKSCILQQPQSHNCKQGNHLKHLTKPLKSLSNFYNKNKTTTSQKTQHSIQQSQVDRKPFLQKYNSDLLFKHHVNKMIKKYQKMNLQQHKVVYNDHISGYTLRIKKINQDLHEAKMYMKYKEILQQQSKS